MGRFCSRPTHPHHYLAVFGSAMSMFDNVCNLEKSVVHASLRNCFNTSMIFLETLLCLQDIGLEEYCPSCYCYSISPPGWTRTASSSGRWYARRVSVISSHPRVIFIYTILCWSGPGHEGHADKFWTKLKCKECFRLCFHDSDLQTWINMNSFVFGSNPFFICIKV